MSGLRRTHRRLVKEILVPEAVAYWEDVLTVVNRGDTIRVNRKCDNNQYFLSPDEATQYCKNKCVETFCGEYRVPDAHLEVKFFSNLLETKLCRVAALATVPVATARTKQNPAKEWREQTLSSTSPP